jgi:hypothetical protein
MMPPSGPVSPQPRTARLGTAGLTPDIIRKRAHTRLVERLDPARSRHKPISLLRQEARRILDLFLELEVPLWPKPDRDRLAEEVIAEAIGLGPLDELFRDEAIQEFMVLAHNRIIARKGDVWMPTSAHFRDPDQYRRALARLAAEGEPVAPAPSPTGGLDVRLANGWRVLAVLPPAVLDQPAVAVFVRAPVPALTKTSGVVVPAARAVPPLPVGSAAVRLGVRETPTGLAGSGAVAGGAARPADPLAAVRQRITEKLIQRLAAAGVYDLGRLPPAELQKVVAIHVVECRDQEKLGFDAAACDQLTLDILAGIQR